MKSHRFKIVLIGAGNVATHLGKQFIKSGHTILQVYSRTETSAQLLSKKLKCSFTSDVKNITKEGNIYIIALKDDAIEKMANSISVKNAVIAHASGSISMSVLKKVSENIGVFYPLQTFSKSKMVNFKNIPICVEGSNEKTKKTLLNLGASISDKVYEIDSGKRKILHLSAVFASNFSNHMYSIAETILKKENIDPDILKPLIIETAAKITKKSPLLMQTGPAVREDRKVIANQLELLKDQKDYQKIYKLLTENIIKNKNILKD